MLDKMPLIFVFELSESVSKAVNTDFPKDHVLDQGHGSEFFDD